jgi:hypothetical protein
MRSYVFNALSQRSFWTPRYWVRVSLIIQSLQVIFSQCFYPSYTSDDAFVWCLTFLRPGTSTVRVSHSKCGQYCVSYEDLSPEPRTELEAAISGLTNGPIWPASSFMIYPLHEVLDIFNSLSWMAALGSTPNSRGNSGVSSLSSFSSVSCLMNKSFWLGVWRNALRDASRSLFSIL